MKQALQLKIGQQLTMTPQLQQAIRLLQLSTLDLQQEIQQALESNPMLERSEESESALDDNNASNGASAQQDTEPKVAHSDNDNLTSSDGNDGNKEDKALEQNESPSNEGEAWESSIPDELPVDTRWEDVYQSSYSASTTEKDDSYFDYHLNHETSLIEHLLWQLNVTPMSDSDRAIAHAIIDSVEPSGLLSSTLEEICEGLAPIQDGPALAQEGLASTQQVPSTDQETEKVTVETDQEPLEEDSWPPSLDEVKAVQKRLQLFDPVGACSQDLSECLLVQLHQCTPETEGLVNAIKIVSTHLPLLASRDYKQLMRICRIKEPELKKAVDLIQTLTPHPGSLIGRNETRYIVPDVFVKKREGHWVVELNPDIAPKLRINNHYANLVKRADNSSENTYLKDNLQEARWFLKSLQSRNDTLLKVATCIVEKQQGFLDCGPESMRPMVLHDIAEEVSMHESTISRVTTQKFMHTPQGIFELKYFFSSHVSTEGGGECSSTAIRAIIKKLVAAENPKKPLSDNKITHLLADQGIKVARRTIAKYRESLGISASNERKRLV